MSNNVIGFEKLGLSDIERVGGKNASLGEMISNLSGAGITVPPGFATTAEAFKRFLTSNNLESSINQMLDTLNVDDLDALAKTGEAIRESIINAALPEDLITDIKSELKRLNDKHDVISVAVRSSATAEDLPDASFAGQQETMLNVTGETDILSAVKQVYASLYNDRAISYRVHQGYAHHDVALSVGIQLMVRSDIGSSGVMFSLDTESGFDQVVFITSAYGLGETIVQGAVNPDEFYVYKPSLKQNRPAILRRNLGAKACKMIYAQEGSKETVETIRVEREERLKFSITDDDINTLAHQALLIEEHYKCPMDIEWAKDGLTNEIYIVQARPETVKSRGSKNVMERFILKETGNVLCEGRSVGHKIGKGPVKILDHAREMDKILSLIHI